MIEDKVINDYYEDNAKKLRGVIDGIIVSIGGVYDEREREDFYSIGNEVFASIINTYDPEKSAFPTYLRNCLSNRIKSEISKRTAKKRTAEISSLDSEEAIEVADDGNFEEEFLSEESAKKMFDTISKVGQKIIRLRLQDKTDTDIKKELGITTRQFEDELKKVRIRMSGLMPVNNNVVVKREEKQTMAINVAPDYRDDYISLELIREKIDEGELLINHPNQRNDWAWSNEDISNLIATNLHGFKINPIIVCEETRADGSLLNWIVDGKQRITSMIHFAYPTEFEKPFKVSKKTEYAEIPYQSKMTDENGNIIRDELGRPILETKVFDIRGRSFAEFPEELQRKFKAFVFTVTRYVNCDSDMISYHIRRYNKGKPMNNTQKATTYLNMENAAMCKKVAENRFFDDVPFRATGINNGSSCKTVMDSIFVINYMDNWVKDLNKMYTFYNENGDASDFALIDEYLTRIDDVIDDETAKLFTPKDAHLFIALFHSFVESGKEDWEFNEFLHDFIDGLRDVRVGGITFDNIDPDDEDNGSGSKNRATRDKVYITTKMNILETLLGNWLNGIAA